jgi:integrase
MLGSGRSAPGWFGRRWNRSWRHSGTCQGRLNNTLTTTIDSRLPAPYFGPAPLKGYPLRHVLLPWCLEHGIARLEDVDQQTLDRWGHDLAEHGGKGAAKLSPSSLATYRRSANQFLKWAAGEDGKAPRLKVGKFSSRDVEPLDCGEISRLEEVALGLGRHRDAVMVRLLGGTGLRPTEALRLTGADLKFTSRRRWVRVSGEGRTDEGKKWEDRELDVTPSLFRRLKELVRSDQEPIFRTLRRDRVTRDFEPLKLDGLEQAIETITAEAEIGKKVIPQTFRHSYCRTMLLKGMPAPVLDKLLGHGSDRMIRVHYGQDRGAAGERDGDAAAQGRHRSVTRMDLPGGSPRPPDRRLRRSATVRTICSVTDSLHASA